MIILIIIATGWPLAPQDSTHPLGNNWGEFQNYGGSSYLHPGIDAMGITVGRPVYAVDSGVVKAWLTTSGMWHWRLAIADYETSDSVEAWLYAHIDPYRYHKDVGDNVAGGELIGYLVEWPVTGFDHLHFARIKDAGAVWEYGDWAFVQNPLVLILPYDDTTKPVFENAYGSDRFAFCRDNTSNYLEPSNLAGNVDIISKIYDNTGLPLSNPVWERLIPYKIEYEIHGLQNLSSMLSFVFYGVLDYTHNVGVIFKDDATCNSRGDYDYRDYYFIVTNTDGDSIIEATDANNSWVTTDFYDGDYWVIVTAYDAAGNFATDSMLVTVKNMIVVEEGKNVTVSQPLTIMPNPNNGSFSIDVAEDIKIFDASGRLVRHGHGAFTGFKPGIYFAVLERDSRVLSKKIVVVQSR